MFIIIEKKQIKPGRPKYLSLMVRQSFWLEPRVEKQASEIAKELCMKKSDLYRRCVSYCIKKGMIQNLPKWHW